MGLEICYGTNVIDEIGMETGTDGKLPIIALISSISRSRSFAMLRVCEKALRLVASAYRQSRPDYREGAVGRRQRIEERFEQRLSVI